MVKRLKTLKPWTVLLVLGMVGVPLAVWAAIDTNVGKYGASQCLASAGSVQLCTGVTTPGRRACAIQNKGPNSIYIGFDTSVTTSTGFEVPSGGTFTIDAANSLPIYCRAATADQSSPSDTRWWGVGRDSQ